MCDRVGPDASQRSFVDLEFDVAVFERLLGDVEALLASFELCPLDGVDLKKVIEVRLVAPGPFEIVEADGTRCGVNDCWILPARQFQKQAGWAWSLLVSKDSSFGNA